MLKFGDALKKLRQSRYRSAREFCLKEKLEISYPQYSRYESGEQLPPLATALQMGVRLQGDLGQLLQCWCFESVRESSDASPEVFSALERVFGRLVSAPEVVPAPRLALGERVSLDDVIVFNRQHLRVFQSDPRFRDVFTYINSFALGADGVSLQEVAASLKIGLAELREMVQRLDDLGILTCVSEDRVRSSKKNFYFPDDQEFFALKNQNLLHNVQEFLGGVRFEDLQNQKGMRGLITRELTETQFAQLYVALEAVMAQMVGMPEDEQSRAVYSLALVLGKRFERASSPESIAESGSAEAIVGAGLTRGLSDPSESVASNLT